MDKNTKIVSALLELSDESMAEVLREVFQARIPYPREQRYFRNHFFLGIATSSLQEEGDLQGQWSEWQINAVAWIDKDRYPNGVIGPGFCQFGTCQTCNIKVASSAKNAYCPVCGAKCFLS